MDSIDRLIKALKDTKEGLEKARKETDKLHIKEQNVASSSPVVESDSSKWRKPKSGERYHKFSQQDVDETKHLSPHATPGKAGKAFVSTTGMSAQNPKIKNEFAHLKKEEDGLEKEELTCSENGQWSLHKAQPGPKVRYSVQLHTLHKPSREDVNQGGRGGTFHVHALTAESPKIHPSNHVGTVETNADGDVEDSNFSAGHQHVASQVHDHIQTNHEKLKGKK